MHPVEDKISAKIQIMSIIDAAIISFEEMTQEVGDTVLMIDSMGISLGIILVPPYTDEERIGAITKGTSLESFVTCESDPLKIFEILESLDPDRDTDGPVNVVIDHSFSVKGVGEVCGKDYISEQSEFIKEWIGAVREAIDGGLSKKEAADKISFLDRYPMDVGLKSFGKTLQKMNVNRLYDLLKENV